MQFFRNEETKFEIFDNFLYVSDDTGDPETPDPITLYHQFDEQVGRTYSQVGFDNGVDYKIISFVHGASITLEGESAAGAQSVLIDAAYNGVSLYHEGDERFFTTAQGATLDAPSPDFVISSATGISSNTIDLVDTTTDFGAKLTFDQGVGWFRVAQADGAGVFEKTWLFCNRDDSVDLYFNNAAVARTLAATAGGLEVNNTLTGAGFERVLTTSDIGEGIEAGTNIGQMLEWSTSSSEYEISNNIGGITSGIAVAASTNTPKVNLYRDSLPASLGGSGTQVLEISGEPFAPAIIRNYVVGRGLQAEGRNAGDTAFHTIFSSDPDGDIGFYFNNVEVARTLTAASGGFEVNNTSTGAGFERVLTTSDLTAIGSPQQLVDGGGNVRVRAEGLGRVELRSAANTDTEDRYIDFVYQNSTRKARVGSFATNATGYTSITDDFRISNEGANETVQIFAQNFSSQDFIAAEFGSSVVRLYDGGQEVVRTAGGFSDGLQVDKQNQGLSGVVTVDDIELEDGEIAVGNPSGIGFSTAIINSSTYRTYAGREIQASSTDTLRFGSVGGSPDEVGGLFRCAGSWSLATDGGGASITLIQISTAGGITTQTISTSTLVPITITATGWWRYVGSSSIRIVLVGF